MSIIATNSFLHENDMDLPKDSDVLECNSDLKKLFGKSKIVIDTIASSIQSHLTDEE